MVKEVKKLVKKLTLKQKKFTAELLKSGNGTKAAIKAGYSKKCAQQIASENLSKPLIQQEIKSAADKLGINAEYVLGNLKKISDFNAEPIKVPFGAGDSAIINDRMRDAGASTKANELLGKHLKLFTDQLDVKVEPTQSNELQEAARMLLYLATQSK